MYATQAVTNITQISTMNPSQQLNINYNGVQSQHESQEPLQQPIKSKGKKPYVKIVEQPAGKALRFRYECEGRSAGSIPGVNSTPENKTYPTIEIVGYKGRAVVVVSCVSKDPPYRPHPHNLVGKEGCKKGVCTIEINNDSMRAVFSNLGIQCVKKKDIDAALKAREDMRVDPFKTGFEHRRQTASIDLNSVRLCFQVFLEHEKGGRFTVPLTPVISDPIYDKKAMSDLVINRLCSCAASVLGNSEIMLWCEKVTKDDISVRFFEEKNGNVWEAYGDFQQTDVHKQTSIAFRTPQYYKLDITEPAKVFIQLRRPSDGVTSEPLPFEYIPLDSDSDHLRRKRQKTNDDTKYILQQENCQKRSKQNQNHADGQQTKITQWNNLGPSIKTEPRETSPRSYMDYQSQQIIHQQQQQQQQFQQPQHFQQQQQQFQQQPFQQQNFHGSTNWNIGASSYPAHQNIQNANNYINNVNNSDPFNIHMLNANPGVHSTTMSNLNQANPFVMPNLMPNTSPAVNTSPNNIAAQPTWNIPTQNLPEQLMLQQQYQQHPNAMNMNMTDAQNNVRNNTQTTIVGTDGNGSNIDENGPTLSNLLTFDSGQLLPLNSQNQQNIQLDTDDLQISNLSIST